MPGALDGIRILDFTRYQQGPYATLLLSDMGADVLKVEEPRHGDLGRALGLQPDGWCAYFQAFNRNKRSLTLDFTKPEGRAIVERLVTGGGFDVVTENFRVGVMKRYGLDYESLSRINPRIITASASGFGPEGPDAARPSFDIIGAAMGGMMVTAGGGPDLPPAQLMPGGADQVGAMVFALGISAAIIARERQGVGQHLDVSLFGSQLALQSLQLTETMRLGYQRPSPQRPNPTFAYFRCADDRYLVIGVLDPKWWPPLCAVLSRPDLAGDARFAAARDRWRNRLDLLAELDQTFVRRPRQEWIDALQAADIPCGRVNDYLAAVQEPQAVANHYVDTLEHPSLGPVGVVATPIRMSATPVAARHTAPELGQHTEEVLGSLGYTPEDIAGLRERGVV